MKNIKHTLAEHLSQQLNKKITDLQQAVLSAKESRDADTKSSAGDKHETSRELAQVEIEKLEVQLNKTMVLENELSSIDLNKKNDSVVAGSLIFTTQENYFISVGLGKIKLEDEIYYAISLNSPIGEILKFKKVGDEIFFQGRQIVIKQIL